MSTGTERSLKPLVAPLAPVALAVMAGIVADRYGDPWGTRVWGIIALAGALVAVACRERVFWSIPALLVAISAFGGGWHHHHWSDLAPRDLARCMSETPRPAWVRGVLRDVLGARPGDLVSTRVVLEVAGISDGLRWHNASGRIQVVILGDRGDLGAGQTVEAAGSLAAIAGPLNPGEFDYRAYLRAQGIRLRLTVDDPLSIWSAPIGADWPVLRAVGAARSWSHKRLLEGLDSHTAPLAAALLLGRREGVDLDINDAFARTGTTHLLAISGLHLQVLAGALWFAFRALGLGRRGAFAAVAASTIAYSLLVGLMPSVVRSAAMTVTVCVAGMRDRRTGPANMLALAALVTLFLNPAHLFDVGCQLSFLAIAAIVWGVTPATSLIRFGYLALTFRVQGPGSALDELERRLEPWWLSSMRRWPLLVTSGIGVSVVVWLVALPLVMLRFHVVSPIGILLNIPLIPLTSVALMASGLTLAISTAWPPLGAPAAWLSALCLEWTEALVRWGATRSWGHTFVAGPSWGWVLVAYVLLALAMVGGNGRWRGRRWLWVVFLTWIALGTIADRLGRRPGALEADILAVGHGLAVVIQDRSGRTIVYDCGRMRDPSVGRRIVAPALWARGVNRIDAVILSHSDADHFDGVPDLLDRFSIAAVRIAPGFGGAANPAAVQLLYDIQQRGIPILPIAAGDRWDSAGAHFSVWHPPARPDLDSSDNARSVVLDIETQGHHALLTGDLEKEGLAALVRRPCRPFDVFLAPHHGGRTANPDWVYAWARPRLVVVSQRPPAAGSRDALAPLDAQGVPLLRTWQRGAIRLRWEAARLEARGFLDNTIPPSAAIGLRAPAPLAVSFLSGSGWQALVATLGFAFGLAACLVLTVVEWGAWALVLPGRRLSVTEPDPDPGTDIEVRAADGTRLAGTWNPVPDAQGRTILLVHGFGEAHNAVRDRVKFLNLHGWNVARLDMRGFGRSEGDRVSFGGRESSDLRAWLDVLAERAGPAPILAVWGRSMGAAIAARAAAEDPRIAVVVLESPYVDLADVVAGWLRRVRFPLPHVFARLITRRARRLAGVSLTRPRPIDLARAITASTLILHGSDDPLVPASDASRLAAALPGPALRLEVPGAGHGNVVEAGGLELLCNIAAFLDEAGSRRRDDAGHTGHDE